MGAKRGRTGVKAASGSSIEINFRYKGQLCRERVKLKPTPANLARAERYRATILNAIENGVFDYAVSFPDSPRAEKFKPLVAENTYGEFLDSWIKAQIPRLKNSSWRAYSQIVKNLLIPNFGKLDMQEITKSAVRAWCASLTAGNQRIAVIIGVMRASLESAVEDGLLTDNDLETFKYRRKEAVKPESDVNPFTRDEQARILAALTGQTRNMFQFAFWTGLRTSELIALDWGDIDLIRRECRITRAWTDQSDEPEAPKSKSGVRTVKLLSPSIDALIAQKENTFLGSTEVFQNPLTLARWNNSHAIRRVWEQALRRAGVAYRRPYQTRHTYASMMLSAGEPEMWVTKQMGHADAGMIRRIYGKWMPEVMPDAGEKAVEKFAAIEVLNSRRSM